MTTHPWRYISGPECELFPGGVYEKGFQMFPETIDQTRVDLGGHLNKLVSKYQRRLRNLAVEPGNNRTMLVLNGSLQFDCLTPVVSLLSFHSCRFTPLVSLLSFQTHFVKNFTNLVSTIVL